MFIDIDRDKPLQKPKYFLAKPNKETIKNITKYTRNDKASFKYGGIHELNFDIPYYIDYNFEHIYNEDVDLIREKMLIRMELANTKQWFIIDEISDVGDDDMYMSVTAYSLPFELSHKRIPFYQTDSITVRNFLTSVLMDEMSPTAWKVGHISPELDNLFRSFDITDTNVMAIIQEAGEAFGAVVIWDTNKREVSFEKIGVGKYKGMSINYGKILRSMNRSRTTDELTTRLYVYGSEDMSIHNVNPTGQPYIEDFSYFMYPFEQDENENVLKSSYFMSDGLCKAIVRHSNLIDSLSSQYKSLVNQRSQLIDSRVSKETSMYQLILERGNIEDRLDMAKATEDTSLISTISIELSNKNSEISDLQSEIDNVRLDLFNKDNEIKNLTDTLRKESNFTPTELDELSFYVIEKEFRDDRYINEEELYEDAWERFKDIREPKVAITLSLDNFFKIIEEQYYWDKLKLGYLIKIKYPQMNMEYMAKLIEIDYNFENDDISIIIANVEKINNMDELQKMLSSSQSTTSILSNNKYKWDKVNEVSDEVYRLINDEIDASKNKIIAGINNEIEIGRRGILVSNPDYPEEKVIIQSGVIALTEDDGETWTTAIKPDGIIAERLIGNILIGRNLVLTNHENTFVFDNDGLKIDVNHLILTSSTSEQPFQDIISHYDSRFDMAEDRISLVVTEDNRLKGEEFVSAINLLPENVKISSKNVEISGEVTFTDLSSELKDYIDFAYDLTTSWKAPNKTTINGGLIETNTIGATSIKTEELIVGQNITMGNNATITWSQVNGTPTSAQANNMISNSSRLTSISASGIYTGTLTSSQVNAVSINASSINAGAINASLITTGIFDASRITVRNLVVGTNVTMGSGATISWSNVSSKPFIPTTASHVGARPNTWTPTASEVGALPSSYSGRLTNITSTGIYTGTIDADKIVGGRLKAVNLLEIGDRNNLSKEIRLYGESSSYASIRGTLGGGYGTSLVFGGSYIFLSSGMSGIYHGLSPVDSNKYMIRSDTIDKSKEINSSGIRIWKDGTLIKIEGGAGAIWMNTSTGAVHFRHNGQNKHAFFNNGTHTHGTNL